MKKLWYKIAYGVSKAVFAFFANIIFPFKLIHRKRIPKRKKHLIVANHLSGIDILYLQIQLKGLRHLVAKKELRKSRFIRAYENIIDLIYVDRENTSPESVKKILALLKKERAVCMFPEGTRNTQNRELLPLKSGATVFAIKSKAPIVPILIYQKAKKFKRNYLYVGEHLHFDRFYKARMTPDVVAEADAILRNHMLTEMASMDDFVLNKRWKRKNRLPVPILPQLPSNIAVDENSDDTQKCQSIQTDTTVPVDTKEN